MLLMRSRHILTLSLFDRVLCCGDIHLVPYHIGNVNHEEASHTHVYSGKHHPVCAPLTPPSLTGAPSDPRSFLDILHGLYYYECAYYPCSVWNL